MIKNDTIKSKRSSLYFGWGYNRAWYSQGNVRLQNNNPQLINGTNYTYDFTVYNVKAKDRPDFNQLYDVANLTIPQFNARIGWYFNNRTDIGFELSYDHTKYVVVDYQKVRMKGQVNGQYFDNDTILDPNTLLHYEHTDGANFCMFNFIKRWKLATTKDQKNNIGVILKPGVGFVYPRTDVTVFGSRINNDWKISGVIGGVEMGVRTELLRNAYIELTGKGGYANYINTLVQGKGYGKASNTFWFFEAILTLGYQLKLRT